MWTGERLPTSSGKLGADLRVDLADWCFLSVQGRHAVIQI